MRDLLDTTRAGLASRYVRKELIHDACTFRTFEELRDSALAHISTQRSSILDGLSSDTSMDGLALTNPYAQAQKNMVAQSAATHSVQPAAGATQWAPPGPARPQGQWGVPAPARAAAPWGPGRSYAVQAMPAQTFSAIPVASPIILRGTARKAVHRMARWSSPRRPFCSK